MRLTKDGQIGNVGCYRSEAGTGKRHGVRLPRLSLRTIYFAILCAALAGSAAAQAQPALPKKVNCAAPEQPQILMLNLVVETLTVQGKSGLHWRVNPLPAGADTQQISDPDLKAAIERWAADQSKLSSDPKNAWVIDGRSDRTFFNRGLSRGLSADFNINPYPVVPPPTMMQAGVKLPVMFCAARAPGVHLDKLEIQVVSVNYDPSSPQSARPLTAALDPGIAASALLSADEAKGDVTAMLAAFARVAETAWQTAKHNRIAIGFDLKSADLRKTETSITAIYNMAQNNIPFQFWGQWPEANAIFQTAADSKCCTLRVRNVQMADRATIRVEIQSAGFRAGFGRCEGRAEARRHHREPRDDPSSQAVR